MALGVAEWKLSVERNLQVQNTLRYVPALTFGSLADPVESSKPLTTTAMSRAA